MCDRAAGPYRPNPFLNGFKKALESVLFNSRGLMAPFYLGLVVGLAVPLYKRNFASRYCYSPFATSPTLRNSFAA